MTDRASAERVPHEVAGERFSASQLPAGRVAVMFTADWCRYCRGFLRHFARVPGGWVVDISEEENALWDDLAIQSVPTVILFEDGKPGRRWAGVLGEDHALQVQSALSEGASSSAP